MLIAADNIDKLLAVEMRRRGIPRGFKWRIFEIMAKYNVRGTVCLNADVCREYPQIIAAGNKYGWEWIGHGVNNTKMITGIERRRRTLHHHRLYRSAHRIAGHGAEGLARASADGDLQYTGLTRGGRHRVSRRLHLRRPAVPHEGAQRVTDFNAVFPGDQ